ncbi:hypothetical protein C8Q73DRAFT_223693 [Cubamyces lactineus]|nr:hypothetical protein C8Q73DRAFT_223693 [Cubamyces lactineus]
MEQLLQVSHGNTDTAPARSICSLLHQPVRYVHRPTLHSTDSGRQVGTTRSSGPRLDACTAHTLFQVQASGSKAVGARGTFKLVLQFICALMHLRDCVSADDCWVLGLRCAVRVHWPCLACVLSVSTLESILSAVLLPILVHGGRSRGPAPRRTLSCNIATMQHRTSNIQHPTSTTRTRSASDVRARPSKSPSNISHPPSSHPTSTLQLSRHHHCINVQSSCIMAAFLLFQFQRSPFRSFRTSYS